MDITVKVRFNASKENFESFGGDRYLLYLPFPENRDAENVLIAVLSKYLSTPAHRIEFRTINRNKDWVFQLT